MNKEKFINRLWEDIELFFKELKKEQRHYSEFSIEVKLTEEDFTIQIFKDENEIKKYLKFFLSIPNLKWIKFFVLEEPKEKLTIITGIQLEYEWKFIK